MLVLGDLSKSLPKFSQVVLDDIIFRFHYRYTVILLGCLGLFSTAGTLFGDPIICNTVNKTAVSSELLNSYCLSQTTYSLTDLWHKKVGVEVVYPGVGYSSSSPKEKRVDHDYYQWVGYVLLGQAILFFLPRNIWKTLEGRKIRMLLLDLNDPLIKVEDRNEKIQKLCDYFQRRFRNHRMYAVKYTVCESLNIINLIIQLCFTNWFLGSRFLKFGKDEASYHSSHQRNYTSPKIQLFPQVTMCDYQRMDSGGKVEILDVYCLLTQNGFYGNIFTFLWYWYMVLMVFTVFTLGYRMATIFSSSVREWILRLKMTDWESQTISKVLSNFDFGDWFVLYLLEVNMDSTNFKELIDKMAVQLFVVEHPNGSHRNDVNVNVNEANVMS